MGTIFQQSGNRVKVSPGGVVQVVGPIAERAAYRGAQKIRGRAISNVRRLGRIDSGRMIRGIQVRRLPHTAGAGLRVKYSVTSSAPYTRFQEEGTRGHGPVRARYLRFKPKGSSTYVFAKWVRGVKPGYFMRDAARATRREDFLP